jgi:hypothetical protein
MTHAGSPIRPTQSSGLRYALAGLLALLILAEYAGGRQHFAVQPLPPAAAPLYAWLAEQPATAIIELPLTSEMAAPPGASIRPVGQSAPAPPERVEGAAGASAGPAPVEAATAAWPDYNLLRYQYFQTGHWQPTADGYSGFVPPHHRELGLTLAHFPDARSLTLLAGLGVERVIIHSELMEAFRPGRSTMLREALARTPGIAVERELGPEWVYRLPRAEGATGPVTGRFWSTADGQAFLILAATSGRTVVIQPGNSLRMQGTWQPTGGGAAQSFDLAVRLPLMIGAGSVLPLSLPRPAVGGAYRLRIEAHDPRIAIAPFAQDISAKAPPIPARLLAVQAAVTEDDLDKALSPNMANRAGQGASGATEANRAITVTLPWRLLDRPDADASISARLLDAAGQKVSQDDRALSSGLDLVRTWQGTTIVTTTHTLRLSDAPGRYTFQAFFYRPDDPADLFFLDQTGTPVAELNWR